MAIETDDDRLMKIAAAITDDGSVDWDDVDKSVLDESVFSVARELRVLHGIVQAHRNIALVEPTTTVSDAGDRVASADPAHWAHFTIIDKIGQGSFGAVYRAHDDRLDTQVALKLLAPASLTDRPRQAERMLDEARRLARVRHPNVVRIYGADRSQGRVGLWMELIKGRSLGDLLKSQGPFGAREATLVGLDLCRAVAAVHGAGLLHGDIKAHNVMREEGGRIVLMDFGAGRELSGVTPQHANLAGTPVYLAPEVLRGQSPTKASDVYALGVLLYHLVTDTYPVVAPTLTEMIRVHEEQQGRRLRDVRPDLPERFIRIVERALAEDPEHRYATAAAFESALAGSTDAIASPPRKKVPWRALALAAVVLAVLGGGWWMLSPSRPASTVANPAPFGRPAVATPATASYDVDAAFYRATPNGTEPLTAGARVAPGDRLQLTFQASVPVHLYVVNEPEVGKPFLLFPLPGESPVNPLPANERVRLPANSYWQVTSRGEREHFVVFAAPEGMEGLEQAFAALPTPKIGEPVDSAELPPQVVERLRGVGGLVPSSSANSSGSRFALLFKTPFTSSRETVSGFWIRQLTLENPTR